MKRVTLIITAVLTVLMLTACSSNKVVYESNTESQGGNKAWTVLINYECKLFGQYKCHCANRRQQ